MKELDYLHLSVNLHPGERDIGAKRRIGETGA